MNQTNQKLIFAVIGATIFMSVSFLLALEWLVIFHPETNVNEKVFTAFITAGSSVLSFLFGILVNTRTTPATSTTEATITTTTAPTVPVLKPDAIVPVQVVNKEADPVPVAEQPK